MDSCNDPVPNRKKRSIERLLCNIKQILIDQQLEKLARERICTCYNFEKFLGNGTLTSLVVRQG